jgi:hypothetical protein
VLSSVKRKSGPGHAVGAVYDRALCRIEGLRAVIEGVKKLFVVQCSIAVCHSRIRLRRGICKKKMREAQPPIANDNRPLNNEQLLHSFIERPYSHL